MAGIAAEKFSSIKAKCPAFKSGCPYSKSSISELLDNDSRNHRGLNSMESFKKCPAFDNGCPFKDLDDPAQIRDLIASVPLTHQKCPVSLKSLCSDG